MSFNVANIDIPDALAPFSRRIPADQGAGTSVNADEAGGRHIGAGLLPVRQKNSPVARLFGYNCGEVKEDGKM